MSFTFRSQYIWHWFFFMEEELWFIFVFMWIPVNLVLFIEKPILSHLHHSVGFVINQVITYCCSTCLLIYPCVNTASLAIWTYEYSSFVMHKGCLLGSLHFLKNFHKNSVGILIRMALNRYISSGKSDTPIYICNRFIQTFRAV